MRVVFENITSGRLSGQNFPPFPPIPQISGGKGDTGERINRVFVQNQLIRVARFMGDHLPMEGS
jgi:hypothetical protein